MIILQMYPNFRNMPKKCFFYLHRKYIKCSLSFRKVFFACFISEPKNLSLYLHMPKYFINSPAIILMVSKLRLMLIVSFTDVQEHAFICGLYVTVVSMCRR